MRAYERNGVTVDQCVDCRGIYLDRGELERLSLAEARFDSHRDTGGHRDSHDGRRGQRKRGFLSELFD